jgi:hypothetical protein
VADPISFSTEIAGASWHVELVDLGAGRIQVSAWPEQQQGGGARPLYVTGFWDDAARTIVSPVGNVSTVIRAQLVDAIKQRLHPDEPAPVSSGED